MTDSDGISINLKMLYIDPLKAYGKFHLEQKADVNASIEGDPLLNPYICKLDEEIFSTPPLNLTPEAIKIWNEEQYSEIFTEMLNASRGFGYAIIQFNAQTHHQIFSEPDRQDWLLDAKTRLPIGIKIVKDWNFPDAKNMPLVEVKWDDQSVFLFKYASGNNKSIFAKADLNQAMWTVAVTHRQIQCALDVMASKPEFFFAHYGQPTPEQQAAFMSALAETSTVEGIGATKQVCESIDVIQHIGYQDLLNVLADKRNQFAGITRLPLAFFNGERTSGSGTGGAAENVVEIKISKRKIILFNKIKPVIIKIFQVRHGMDVSAIELDLTDPSAIVAVNDQKVEQQQKLFGNQNPNQDTNKEDITTNDDPSPPPAKKKGWFNRGK
jgi:hypothetical protein